MPYSAGMLSYASWFTIPPRKKKHLVLNHCCYKGFQPLHTFAVRVHTHTMGREVFMTRAPAAHNAGKWIGGWGGWVCSLGLGRRALCVVESKWGKAGHAAAAARW